MSSAPNFKFLTLRISGEFHSKVKEFCARHNISMKQFSVEAFNDKMNAIEKKVNKLKAKEEKTDEII